MKISKEALLSKKNLGVFGIIFLLFGFSGLLKNLMMIINGYPIFKVIFFIKILTIFYYIFLAYLVILGVGLLKAKRWVSKLIMPTPFLFLFFIYFTENAQRLSLTYIIFWFAFFLLAVIFANVYNINNKETGGQNQ